MRKELDGEVHAKASKILSKVTTQSPLKCNKELPSEQLSRINIIDDVSSMLLTPKVRPLQSQGGPSRI